MVIPILLDFLPNLFYTKVELFVSARSLMEMCINFQLTHITTMTGNVEIKDYTHYHTHDDDLTNKKEKTQ